MPNDNNDITSTMNSYGYKLLHERRRSRDKTIGGGVGIILKNAIVSKHIKMKQFCSFEHTIVKVKIKNNGKLTLVTIYRVLFLPVKSFLEELTILLEILNANSEYFISVGDDNIHLDDKEDIYKKQFNDILEMFNLKQHVNFPTHRHAHLIDVVVSQLNFPIIENIGQNNVCPSDHFIVQFEVKNIVPEKKDYEYIKYSEIKSVNNEHFCCNKTML